MDASWLFAGLCFFAVGVAVGIGLEEEPFPEFVPKFGKGKDESFLCYVIAEERKSQLDGKKIMAYQGCYSAAKLIDWRASWQEVGMEWPYKVVAVFNREVDTAAPAREYMYE